ncbi:MAG: hypothetical protein F6J95_016975 [Leptolyngbya sp. SIO1E4]|nr:hypothetical protein [Leptolyngbya sp. SIO1E4]
MARPTLASCNRGAGTSAIEPFAIGKGARTDLSAPEAIALTGYRTELTRSGYWVHYSLF